MAVLSLFSTYFDFDLFHRIFKSYLKANRIYNKIIDRDWFAARLFVTWVSDYRCPFELFQIGHL